MIFATFSNLLYHCATAESQCTHQTATLQELSTRPPFGLNNEFERERFLSCNIKFHYGRIFNEGVNINKLLKKSKKLRTLFY